MRTYTFSFYTKEKRIRTKVILPKWYRILARLKGKYTTVEEEYFMWVRKYISLEMTDEQEELFIEIVKDKDNPLSRCIYGMYETKDINISEGFHNTPRCVQLEMGKQVKSYIKTTNECKNN